MIDVTNWSCVWGWGGTPKAGWPWNQILPCADTSAGLEQLFHQQGTCAVLCLFVIKCAVKKTKALISEAWRCLSEIQVPFWWRLSMKTNLSKIKILCLSWKVGGGLWIIEGGRIELLDLKHKHIVFLSIRKSIFIAPFPLLICLGESSYFWDNKLLFTSASSL